MTQRSLWLRNNIYVLGIISALLFGLETGAVSPVFAETQDQGPAADEDAIPVEKIYNESRTQEPKEKITQPVEPASSSGETDEPEPKGKLDKGLIVNGDIVEYSTDTSAISASGNVVVVYGEATLTCDKLTGNSATKDVEAEGNVRLDDKRGVILGSRMTYNFQAQTGTLYDAGFRANPYFGRAEKLVKVSDAEYLAYRGRMSTCSFDRPHYFFRSNKVEVFPGDKIKTKDDTFYIGPFPILYAPEYSHSLKDPIMHVQVSPGKTSDWGGYLLTATRYKITENIMGRIYADYRSRLGFAEGFGLNYKTASFGRGDYKFYYTHEKDKKRATGEPDEFQRYLIRWRHKWEISERTNVVSEYYKIEDSKRATIGGDTDFLKDYFYREYEKDSQPPSYLVLHHIFDYSSFDFMMQKRTNRWYDPGYVEKLPEARYTMPLLKLGESPFYFESASILGNYNRKNTSTSTPDTNASTPDTHFNRLDTTNKFSLPLSISFLRVAPFVGNRETFYDKDTDGDAAIRTIFFSGVDLSTKFYRTFNVNSDFMGMDLNGLRHIITPTIAYYYGHRPTITKNNLRQIDEIDALTQSNYAALALSNKLQTKRKGQSVDVVDFRISTAYNFRPVMDENLNKNGSSFSDFLLELKLLPYSWLRLDSDAAYDKKQGYFRVVNNDINFKFAEERSVGFGHRYERKGGKQMTFNVNWRLNPKWKFGIYERYEFADVPGLNKKGLREQQYTVSRDMHCWVTELTFNSSKEEGQSIWVIFRLKAFPEMEFGFDQSYHKPESGSQPTP